MSIDDGRRRWENSFSTFQIAVPEAMCFAISQICIFVCNSCSFAVGVSLVYNGLVMADKVYM